MFQPKYMVDLAKQHECTRRRLLAWQLNRLDSRHGEALFSQVPPDALHWYVVDGGLPESEVHETLNYYLQRRPYRQLSSG